jgi:hypothetical protein
LDHVRRRPATHRLESNGDELTPENVKNLKLEWSLKLDSPPKELTGLTAPLARATMATPLGVKDPVVVAGLRGQVFVIDGDTGKIVAKDVGNRRQPGARCLVCPNALNPTPLIGPAPHTGSARGGQALYVLASDGKLHTFNLVSSEDILPPLQMLPAFVKTWSLNTAGNVIYTTTSQGCNGLASGVYVIDLSGDERKAAFFRAGNWVRDLGSRRRGDHVRRTAAGGNRPYDVGKNLLADSVISLSPKDLKLTD